MKHILILITAIVFRFWLLTGIEPYIIAPAMHDDGLFMNQGISIARGLWLGEFHERTLIKGAGFPIFLALNFYTGLPALISLQLLLTAGLLMFAVAFYRSGLKACLVLMFFILALYHPAFVTVDASRITRDFFYAALVTFWLSAIFLFFKTSNFSRHICALLSSLAFAWILITREEGIWLGPFIISGLILVWLFRGQLGIQVSQIAYIGISHLILAVAVLLAVAQLNRHYYGSYILTEFQNSSFKKAYGALTRIDSFPFRQYVPVSKEKRTALYEISPSFAELKPYLEDPSNGWISPGCGYIQPCDDLSSHFIWAFRDAAGRAGHYGSLQNALNFYDKMADEIDSACRAGKISCKENRSSLAPAYSNQYLPSFFNALYKGLRRIMLLDPLPPFNNLDPLGKISEVYRLLRFTNHKIAGLDSWKTVQGWAITKSGEAANVYVTGPLGKEYAEYSDSPDVHKHHSDIGYGQHPSYSKARFIINSRCSSNCYLIAEGTGGQLLKYSLDTSKVIDKSDGIEFNIEHNTPVFGLFEKIKKLKFAILSHISDLYQKIIPGLAILSALALILALIKRKQGAALYIFPALAAILVSSRLFLLSYLDATSFDGINTLYLLPVFLPLIMMMLSALHLFFDRK